MSNPVEVVYVATFDANNKPDTKISVDASFNSIPVTITHEGVNHSFDVKTAIWIAETLVEALKLTGLISEKGE